MQKCKDSMPGKHDKERLLINQKAEVKRGSPKGRFWRQVTPSKAVPMTYFWPLDPISQLSHSEHPTDEGSSLIAQSLFSSPAALDHVFNSQACKGIQCLSHSTGLCFRANKSYAKCDCCRWFIMGKVTATAPA